MDGLDVKKSNDLTVDDLGTWIGFEFVIQETPYAPDHIRVVLYAGNSMLKIVASRENWEELVNHLSTHTHSYNAPIFNPVRIFAEAFDGEHSRGPVTS